ncbi:hypothetical protein P170DRAFT_382068 [Aspergillus steynii IBT 23096]|uniref:Uncharacterized protein n=1 Tax=Aspergillus steynii IBT 23096 TaxID=1392250 RepID=A0A2I2GDK8_9EURO|nr:uncharacterized protein P170DRAFT_382068 [Aspergillus steynii IBT 23096]PLB50986.1 hypothetical protein P170DRAFT_382068 [Aspergillus steynii IBT 23096]
MDLSKLTRPAILCQCSRCSSSLAALENEWAKLSNSYSVAAGWLSVELHRISISSEKKQVPQSSDLSLLRGRILQEVACKLCQQKLGVLCALDNGPNVFWKLSKVSFREIVTMRTVEPSFKEGALDRLMNATPKEPAKRDRTSIQPGALVPAGANELDPYNASVEQQIQYQGLSIDNISSSVSNLHDTMSELKSAFTALRIELNGPGRFPEVGHPSSPDFNMITTVLRELKFKSDEIEKLNLEIEALKMKNRYMEEAGRLPAPLPQLDEAISQVRSPGLLQGSRKRPLPDYFESGGRTHPIADSFDDDDDDSDSIGDFLAEPNCPPVKIPLKEPEHPANSSHHPTSFDSPNLRIEVTHPQNPASHPETPTINGNTQQPAVTKRPRVSQSTERPSSSGTAADRRKAGRPRKSISQATNLDFSETPKPTPLSEQNGNAIGSTQRENPPANQTPSEPSSTKENRPARSRSLRSRSRPPSTGNRNGQTGDNDAQEMAQTPSGPETRQSNGSEKKSSSSKAHSTRTNGENGLDSEKRKAQVATRDAMARLAMQREEAMETEEAR